MARVRQPDRPAESPLRGRYLVRHAGWNAWLRANDFIFDALVRRRDEVRGGVPRRVLLAVGGQLGDAVIASSVLPRLHETAPNAEIGIVCGSWSRCVFEGNPLVRDLYSADHWKWNRGVTGMARKWLTWERTRSLAVAGIRARGYDLALDLSAYYPNYAWLLWRAGIPRRVGFESGGYGALYTHALAWQPGRHVASDLLAVLAAAIPSASADAPMRYALHDPPASAVATASATLARLGVAGDYVVLHPGAGLAIKEWPARKWREVATALASTGIAVVVTGSGAGQRATAAEITSGVRGAANACDAFSWDEFRAAIRGARVVASVDTVAMHVAGAEGTACVALMTGIDVIERWKPLGDRVTVLSAAVRCAPCYLSRGCEPMTCVRGIRASDVLAAVSGYLHPVSSPRPE